MQRRPLAKTRMTEMDDLEGGGSSPSPYGGGIQRQASNASRTSNGPADALSLDNGSAAAVLFSDDSQGKGRKRVKSSISLGSFTNFSGDALRIYALVLLAVTAILFSLCSVSWSILLLVAIITP